MNKSASVWKKQKDVRIDFIKPDGKEDYEFLSDLWCGAREVRKTLPRYSELQIIKIEVIDE